MRTKVRQPYTPPMLRGLIQRVAPNTSHHPYIWDLLRRARRSSSRTILERRKSPFDWLPIDLASNDGTLAPFDSLRDSTYRETLEVARSGASIYPTGGWIVASSLFLEENSVIDAHDHRDRRPGMRRYLAQSFAARRRDARIPPALSFRTIGETNYFHVLNDLLGGRLRLSEEVHESRGLPIVVSEMLAEQSFFRDLRRFPGLRDREWIIQRSSQMFTSDALYFGATSPFSKQSFDFVRALLRVPDSDPSATARLLILRSPEMGRSLANQDEIVRRCARLGFRLTDPGTMSVPEQIETFSNARVVVAMHGAAMANLTFRRNGPLDVIELFPGPVNPRYAHFFYLCHEYGFTYQAVATTKSPATSDSDALLADPDNLEAILRPVLDAAS